MIQVAGSEAAIVAKTADNQSDQMNNPGDRISDNSSATLKPTVSNLVVEVASVPLPSLNSDVPPAPEPNNSQAQSGDSQLSTLNPQPSTLDFATVLALVSGQNPQVAFAQERINEAFARLDAARALWLPSLRGGASYNKHEGSLQDVRGDMLNLSRGSVFTGFGARAVGAGSPTVPGLSAQFHLADAVFQPIIAQRTAAARQHKATAVTNDALLDAAVTYVELLRAVRAQAIATDTLKNAGQLAKQTATFAKSGQAPQADADRAQTELALRQNDVTRADEAIQVASARLAEVLSLDASLELRPAESVVTPIELVAADSSLNELVATALSNRPELCESQFLTSAAFERLQRERYAPFIPNLALGLSYGGYGGGVGGDVDSYRDRMDFDAVAFWEVRNFGFGERAARDEAHALVHQAQHREVQVMNRVAREVAEAYAQMRSRKKQIAVAERGISAAQDSYRRNLERIREGQGLPIEVLQSIQALDQAQREHLRAITDYNTAQFRLHRALGWPIVQ